MVKEYIYKDPYDRYWTKEELDEAMKLFHNLKENMTEIMEYY